MPAVESVPNNLRRIAVLVASVDAATARQLLLQLPTTVAKEVRAILQTLGPISPAERQRIIAEFQSTAARQVRSAPSQAQGSPKSQASHGFSSPYRVDNQQPSMEFNRSHPAENQFSDINTALSNDEVPVTATGTAANYQDSPKYRAGADSQKPSSSNDSMDSNVTWKRMDTRALSRFLAGERPTVIAVVISQLAPQLGVALLQQLPVALHAEVLQRLVHLQEIDSEAMQAIDDHLAGRLKHYEHQVNSEVESNRRVSALIAVAPAQLQQTWLRMLREANAESAVASPAATDTQRAPAEGQVQLSTMHATQAVMNRESNQYPDVFGSVITTADLQLPANASRSSTNSIQEGWSATNMEESADVNILPFPGPTATKPMSNLDRSLLQLDFERLLQLNSQQLAQVLTRAEAPTVLLALAGASPAFIKRFYLLLTKSDAKILAGRLSQIGPLKLRDIDEAQRQIVELTATLFSSRQNQNPVRAAA